MARWRNNYEHDLKLLIHQLTGFQEGEENFDLCLQFASSNIRYHRFLDVDSHKVTKAVNGIIEKFAVHSEAAKCKAFEQLSDEFLSQPIFEDKDHGKTDTHYALLLLLLNLSNNPTRGEYIQKPRQIQVAAPVVEFDWAGFLLEGLDVPFQKYNYDSESDEEAFDESDDDGEKDDSDENQGQENPPFADISLSTISPDDSTLVAVDDDGAPVETGFNWLARNVVVQYWCGQSEEIQDPSCNLNRDWERFKENIDDLYNKPSQVILSETPIIREILWMLSGVTDLFIFMYNGHRFLVREDVDLSHLTDNALRSYLQEFIEHGAYVQDLVTFEQDVITKSCCLGNQSFVGDRSNKHGICQTYQAFSRAVASFIKSLRQDLVEIEKTIIKQEETFTLVTIHAKLKNHLEKIKLVHMVYQKGVKVMESLSSNCQKASHLLSVLFNTMMEYDAMGTFAVEMMNLLLVMWVETSKPYIDVIDEWITNGFLVDPRNEFIIKRNDKVTSLDESFWETAFTIHIAPDESLLHETTEGQKQIESNLSKVSPSHWAPQFLQPILLEVVLSGKSMEMLQGLGRLQEVVGNQIGKRHGASSLYDTFVDSLHDCLSNTSRGDNSLDITTRETTPENSVFTPEIEQQMKIKGIFDPLLKMNFQNLFSQSKSKSSLSRSSADSLNSTLASESMKPFDSVLQECLYPHVRSKYKKVCLRLVQILKEEYKLMEYLAAMRHFFLMDAGDMMFIFYTQIFDKIRLHEQWRDMSTVNLILQEALQEHYQDEANRMTVEIVTLPASKSGSPINITDCLKLHYKVPWPVDVVISTKCQDVYNEVFTFLLQIKRAKYCLDQLRFPDLQRDTYTSSLSMSADGLSFDEEMSSTARTHRMYILRTRLLFFVNSLHNYIMTRILHSTGLEFKEDLQKAEDLDQIIEVHNSYVSKIYERCLLHKKVMLLRDAVMKVLNLSLHFCELWDKTIQNISLTTIQDMELEFSRCIHFLASFLNNVIKRGSFPHLEPLAFALISSTECVYRTK